jgi:transcriptional regulator with XRE-family HTH domain
MPRPNEGRTIHLEANLARRISFERATRCWTYERLAREMTDAGCAIAPSAIYKIEKGDPPRRVTVDEMGALATVFEVSYDDLLTPMTAVTEKLASQLSRDLQKALDEHRFAQANLLEVTAKVFAHGLQDVIEDWDGLSISTIEDTYMPDISQRRRSDAVERIQKAFNEAPSETPGPARSASTREGPDGEHHEAS